MIVSQFIGPPGPALASSAPAEARRLEILPRHRRQRGAGSAGGGARGGAKSCRAVHARVRPNQSLKRSANGMPPGPGLRYSVHFLSPGPGVIPSSPA